MKGNISVIISYLKALHGCLSHEVFCCAIRLDGGVAESVTSTASATATATGVFEPQEKLAEIFEMTVRE